MPRAAAVGLALAAVLAVSGAAADEPFYKGKRLTVMIVPRSRPSSRIM
jgi:hypothetical protein